MKIVTHRQPHQRPAAILAEVITMNGKLTLALAAALALPGCATVFHHARAQGTPAALQKVDFDCNVKQTAAFHKALGFSEQYCIGSVDLDSNKQTAEMIVISLGAGGSGGDPIAVFQKQGEIWNRIDNQDQLASVEGVAVKPNAKGWSQIVTNYGSGFPENIISYTAGKYRANLAAPK